MLILEPVIGLLGVPAWPDSVCATGTEEAENRAALCQACALARVLMTVIIPSGRRWPVFGYFCTFAALRGVSFSCCVTSDWP